MHLDSASEYWHRSGSLVVTDPAGERDSEIPPEVRVYVFGGTQHGPAARPHDRGQLPPSPTPFRPFQQALFLAMDRWITDGTPPPPSVHPRIADGTLVEWQEEPSGWIPLPNVRYPTVIQQPELLDYGKDFAKHRRIERQPPLRTGKQYGVRVPALDADNNERGALQMPSVAVPLATFTGWNLRNPASGAPDALVRLTGGRIPFPRTAADRERTGDPRRAVTERYASFEDYLEQYMTAAEKLLAAGYLVDEHMDGLEAHAQSARPLFGGGKP